MMYPSSPCFLNVTTDTSCVISGEGGGEWVAGGCFNGYGGGGGGRSCSERRGGRVSVMKFHYYNENTERPIRGMQ